MASAEAHDPVVVSDGLPWRFPALQEGLAQRYRVLEPEGDLGAAIAAWGLERYALVGVSLGASAAAWHAVQSPERVAALVLVSPLALRPAAGAASAARLFAHPEAVALPTAALPTAAVEEAWWERRRGATHDAELESRLGEIQCPTLAVFGQEDALVSPPAASIYRERIANCSIAFVYDAGHAIAAERPQALVSLVADYLERRETFIVENRTRIINP